MRHSPVSAFNEMHYYPFGLTMAGISFKASGVLENKKKWNVGSELNTDLDIHLYETFYRNLDPQIGRFWQVDPKPREYESPFVSMGNNPISNIDPNGDYFFGLFGSTSDQRKAARAFAKETNGSIENITKKYVSVTFSAENGDGGIGISKTNFDKDGFPKILGQEARSDFSYHKNGFGFHKNHETGALEHTPASGRVEMADDPLTTLGPGLIRSFLGKLITKLGTASGGIILEEGAQEATSALKHSFKYADRVRSRALQDPVSHNFPYSFDDAVLKTNPVIKNNGYKMFQQQGTMNGKNGVFEIGLTKDGIIDHRFFKPNK